MSKSKKGTSQDENTAAVDSNEASQSNVEKSPFEQMSVSTAALLSSINQPPTFAGKKDEDLDRFLHKADSFFRRLPIPASQQALYLSDWLKGEAETWYLTLESAVQNDYATLVKALRDRFSNTKNRILRKIELSSRVQAPGESVDTYVVAFRRLVQRIGGMSVEDQIEAFLRGLHADISRDVLKDDPATLDDCIECARKYERVLHTQDMLSGRRVPQAKTQPEPTQVNAINAPVQEDRRVDKLARQMELLTGVVSKLDKTVEDLTKTVASVQFRQVDGHRKVDRQFQDHCSKIDALGIPVCTRCRRVGHNADQHDEYVQSLWNSRSNTNAQPQRKNE